MEGQIEFAISCALHSCRQDFMCGQNLVEHAENSRSCAAKMVSVETVSCINELLVFAHNVILLLPKALQNQDWSSKLFASHHEVVLKLIGADVEEAFKLLPDSINNADDLLEVATSTGQKNLQDVVSFYKLLTAFWFRQYDEVAKYPSRRVRGFLDVYHLFFEGISALHLARKRDEDEESWTKIGEKAVSSFQNWAKCCDWNFENKILLLEAELHFLKGEYVDAEGKYKASIGSAYKHQFVNEEGLAMELAGKFLDTIGKTDESSTFLLGARACYEKWGASSLVPHINDCLKREKETGTTLCDE